MIVYINGVAGPECTKIMMDAAAEGQIRFTKNPKESDFLIVGDYGNYDVFAQIIFEDLNKTKIVTDNQFLSYLKEYKPEYFL